MKPFLILLALASLLLFGCEPEGQDIAFEVNVTQWANPDLPEVGATVVLEEQRLTNGVLNSFFTEIERATTSEGGVVELQTVRSNVLALRIRVEQADCFDEIVDLGHAPVPCQRHRRQHLLALPQLQHELQVDATRSGGRRF